MRGVSRSALALLVCLMVAKRSFVSAAPSNQVKRSFWPFRDTNSPVARADNASKHNLDPLREQQSLSQMTYGGPQVGDEVVRDLERLKPLAKSISMIKTQSTMYTNVNGQKEEHTNTKAQVAKDGELIARVAQNVDKTPNNPEPHVRTAVDIPSQNIHKVSEHGPKSDSASQQPPLPYNNYKKVSQYSPLDMAEYVFWTGDEKGVTTAIEEFLQEGLMSREEAIGYLQDIKQNLELLKDHYSEERYQRQLAAKDMLDDE